MNISVIIPTYNRSIYIKDSIDSILKQKLSAHWRIEVIVVDDGSTDNTEEILKSYIQSEKIRYYKLPHSGKPAVPRNFAIKKAKSELIAFQDSDDIWPTDKLIKQLPVFKNKDVVLSYGNAEIINQYGEKTGINILKPNIGKSGYVFRELLQENFISTLTVIARKDAIEKAGLFNSSERLIAVEDYHLWLRMSLEGEFCYIDDTLALYRKHDANISPKDPRISQKHLVNVYSSIYKEIPTEKKIIKVRLLKTYDDYAHLLKFPKKQITLVKRMLLRGLR